MRQGYTLLEISIVVSMVTVLGLISGTVMIRGLQVVGMQNAYADVSDAMRTAALTVNNELSLAVLNDLPGSKLLKGLTLDPKDPSTISFQPPLSLDGLTASPRVTLRVRNEDQNKNLTLDEDEDLDKNGVLDRVLERLEDLNGDGAYDKSGEVRVLARNIDSISFEKEPNARKLRVRMLARSAMRIGDKDRTVEKEHEFTVFIRN